MKRNRYQRYSSEPVEFLDCVVVAAHFLGWVFFAILVFYFISVAFWLSYFYFQVKVLPEPGTISLMPLFSFFFSSFILLSYHRRYRFMEKKFPILADLRL